MNIYILKFLAAITNIFVISYAVGYFPSSLSSDYMLALAYTILGLIVVGLGIEVSIERYATRVLTHISKLELTLLIFAISFFRTVVLLTINEAVNTWLSPLIETNLFTTLFVFCTCLFLTIAATLNGVHMYVSSATANVIRGICRLPIALIPVAGATLPLLLSIEIGATLIATTYCLTRLRGYRPNHARPIKRPKEILKFMSWNWIARLTSNLSALNTVKILVLRSDDVNAVLVAYIIQLAQSVERFLPSKVLAGRYRPALASLYDNSQLELLRQEILTLSRNNIVFSAAIAVCFIFLVIFVFNFYMPEMPTNFCLIVFVSSANLFLLNGINSLNIFSNITEESRTIFVSSFVMGLFFITGALFFGKNNPTEIMVTLLLSTLTYFPVWFFASWNTVKRILSLRS